MEYENSRIPPPPPTFPVIGLTWNPAENAIPTPLTVHLYCHPSYLRLRIAASLSCNTGHAKTWARQPIKKCSHFPKHRQHGSEQREILSFPPFWLLEIYFLGAFLLWLCLFLVRKDALMVWESQDIGLSEVTTTQPALYIYTPPIALTLISYWDRENHNFIVPFNSKWIKPKEKRWDSNFLLGQGKS